MLLFAAAAGFSVLLSAQPGDPCYHNKPRVVLLLCDMETKED